MERCHRKKERKRKDGTMKERKKESEKIGKMKNTAVFTSHGVMVHIEILNMTPIHKNSSDFNQLLINIQGKN